MSPARLGSVAVALTLMACGGGQVAEEGTVGREAQAPTDPPALSVLRTAAALGYTGPEEHPFEVRLRTPAIEGFPCAACHDEPVAVGDRGTEGHADVQPVHPSELAGRCDACHSVADPARLTLGTGELATLDEAYRLCVQCHYGEGDSWAGGAHGKRLVGWAGRRVVMSCTECHDPHRPTFAPRIPFRPPNIPRTGARRP